MYDVWDIQRRHAMLIQLVVQQRNNGGAWWAGWVRLSLSRITMKTDCVWWRGHTSEHSCFWNPISLVSWCSVELPAMARWLLGIAWHSPAPYCLNLLRDQVSKCARCLSFNFYSTKYFWHSMIYLMRSFSLKFTIPYETNCGRTSLTVRALIISSSKLRRETLSPTLSAPLE